MKACRLHSIGDFRCEEIEKPTPTGSELLVKVESCGVCGSDIPRIYAHGTSNGKYPLTLGHEFGGRIVEVGEDADPSLIGKRGAIFPVIPCMKCEQCKQEYYPMCENYDYLGSRNNGGFAQYCLIPSEWNFVEIDASIAESFDPRLFAMVEPCTVAQHAVRATGLGSDYEGGSIVIFGAGPIGIMAAHWAKIFGAEHVVLVDVVEEKVAFAKERGFFCINSTTEDLNAAVAEFFEQNWQNIKHADAVIEGTGFGGPLGSAIEIVKPHGTIVLMGNPATDTQIKLAQHSMILRKEAVIKGIWNSSYSEKHVNEWKYTLEHLGDGSMKADDLISHEVKLNELPQLCEDIYNKKINICKAIALP